MSPIIKLDIVILCLAVFPAVVFSFVREPSTKFFEGTVFRLVPYALSILLGTFFLKWHIDGDKNRMNKQ